MGKTGFNALRDAAIQEAIREWALQQHVVLTVSQIHALADKLFVKACSRCTDPDEGFRENDIKEATRG